MTLDFKPPSLPDSDLTKTYSHHHRPQFPTDEPVILGVDEAGRGPVLGPMVYAVAYCPLSYREELATHGYNDSKVLKSDVRLELFKDVLEQPKRDHVGWATTVMTAADIGDGMLRPDMPYNLNDQAHDTTMALIDRVLGSGVRVAEVYVDTVGPPDKYQAKLAARFPGIEKIVVAKKADALYPIVSLASICAKVTRDLSLEQQLGGSCGSGYPADPATVKWLDANFDKLFGWGPLVRYSWGTAKNVMDRDGFEVTWKADIEQAAERRKFFTAQSQRSATLPQVGMTYFGEHA